MPSASDKRSTRIKHILINRPHIFNDEIAVKASLEP
ncbi:protein of unknown function [Pseudomonas sp. JV551A1]|nr:protein of unknown function [Pseudomonas sp. JV551A1]